MGDYLNNNDIDAVVNEAYAIATGSKDVTNLTLKDIIDAGSTDGGALVGKKEPFTKALISLWAKNLFLDERIASDEDDFYVDSRQWAGILQTISAQAPAVQESHAWQEFVSGTSTVGTYTVYMPIVSTNYYGKTSSWELPISISYEQYADAFKDADGFNSFRSYVFVCIENAIVQHRKDMNNANRNNFIAQKYAYQTTVQQTGVYYVQVTHVAAADDVITICGHDITWKTSGATGQQINLPSSDTAAKEVTALVTYLNGLTSGQPSYFTWSAGASPNTDRLIATQKAGKTEAVPVTASVSEGATMTIGDVQTTTEMKNPKGIHVFKLRSMYNSEMSPASPVANRAAFMKDKECLRYMSRKIAEYVGYMTEQSSLFNTENLVKFVPKNRLVLQVLNYAEQAANSILQADTFHDLYTAMPNHRSVSAWQGLGDGVDVSENRAISFDDISKINVTIDDGTTYGKNVELTGIVAFCADKYAIIHTIRSTRVAARNFDPEALDMYFYQYRDQYINVLSQNAIVFMVD